ncbi:hypothetical protein UA08_00400 [Talaromyces atroroseus]|uniref:Putative gamma-glutamylcyclotransferase n=1 Tax=Talaromyces atroroseus TaxID=1441469 RepID=A0A225B8H6_TALAT|nr:hypothetical protein UA08_00400 [Talaromyces atroroseus]OKL64389.1 hypothetical protein UA08_00400 [Talaromyces atroroseus]
MSDGNHRNNQTPAVRSTGPNEASAGSIAAAISGLLLLRSRFRRNAVSESSGPLTQVRTRASIMRDTSSNSQQAVNQGGVQRPRQAERKRGAGRSSTAPQAASNASPSINFGAGRPGFTAFQGIIRHAHIIFHFANCLDIDDLIALYSISKDFHDIIDSAMTAVILAKAMQHAPTAATIFPFRCYRKLCIDDPLVELDRSRGHSRLVPSFRWLRMVCWREQVAKKTFWLFNNEGLWLPRECESVIKKVWFLMDIPDNQRRMATIQNSDLWTTSDLFHAIMFFMRIDMRCINPIVPVSHGNIRRMLLAQPTMSMLYRVMARTWLTDTHEALQTYLRWKYRATDRENHPLFGVPRSELGRMQYEGYGVGGSRVKLQRPDDSSILHCYLVSQSPNFQATRRQSRTFQQVEALLEISIRTLNSKLVDALNLRNQQPRTSTNMADAGHTFFFYGTLMVPAILHRIIHGSPTPEPWQKALITTRPALLPGYRRYRVIGADYPAVLKLPSSSEEAAASSVLGVVVTGLTEGDIIRLDSFEGSKYTKRPVTVKVVKNSTTTSSRDAAEGDDENDNVALQRGLAETAHLADGSVTDTEEVEATTYVWTDPESLLELNSEWDFESFKRDKLQWWINAPESEL